jgi:hypothetical protein
VEKVDEKKMTKKSVEVAKMRKIDGNSLESALQAIELVEVLRKSRDQS